MNISTKGATFAGSAAGAVVVYESERESLFLYLPAAGLFMWTIYDVDQRRDDWDGFTLKVLGVGSRAEALDTLGVGLEDDMWVAQSVTEAAQALRDFNPPQSGCVPEAPVDQAAAVKAFEALAGRVDEIEAGCRTWLEAREEAERKAREEAQQAALMRMPILATLMQYEPPAGK